MKNILNFNIEKKIIKKANNFAKKAINLEEKYKKVDDQKILKTHFEFLNKKNVCISEKMALFSEICSRKLGLKPYKEQLMGAYALYKGTIAEMKTGEGKTLVALIASYLSYLENKKSYVVTVNNYLSSRDCEFAKRVFSFLDVKINHVSDEEESFEIKTKLYAESDIIYVSNTGLGFDYLRSNIVRDWDYKMIKDFKNSFVIIDEVDSILIDEAKTPLILSGQAENFDAEDISNIMEIAKNMKGLILDKEKENNKLISFDNLVDVNKNEEYSNYDYVADRKTKSVNLTNRGYDKFEKLLVEKKIIKEKNDLYTTHVSFNHILSVAIKSIFLYKKDVEYVIKNNKVELIDESTGRVMEGRQLNNGLHQAIEVKERVTPTKETTNLAEISYQNLFKLFEKISGMTGTAFESKQEFKDTYNLDVCRIPTVRNVIRNDMEDIIFLNKKNKFDHVAKKIEEINKRKRPILIGTNSVADSEYLSKLLFEKNIKHNVLNAKNHLRESEIVANAGSLGAVTISTSMAGRGTDIILGGNYSFHESGLSEEEKEELKLKIKKEREKVIELGGLFVLGVERNKSRRVDDQLIGRAGRQGDPGASQFSISLEDDLFKIFSKNAFFIKLIKEQLKNKNFISNMPQFSKFIKKCQETAGNHEENLRNTFIKFDNILDYQRQTFYKIRDEILKKENDYIDINDGGYESKILKDLETEVNVYVDYLINKKHVFFNNEDIISKIREDTGLNIILKEIDSKLIKRNIFKEINKIKELISSFNLSFMLNDYKLTYLDECWSEQLSYSEEIKRYIGLRSYANKKSEDEYKREMWLMFNKNIVDFPTLKSFKKMKNEMGL